MNEDSITILLQNLQENFEKNILYEGIPFEFPSSLLELTADDFPDDCDYRKDLTHQPCITIDDEDTKDMDDALFMEDTQNGYRLWSHIADVASFLRLDDELYEEAQDRTTSIYLPDKIIRMLPPLLSEDLCSLKAGENRRAMSFCIELNKQWEVLSLKIYRSMIRPAMRCTYDEIESILEEKTQDPALQAKYDGARAMIQKLDALAAHLAIEQNNEPEKHKKIKIKEGQLFIKSTQHARASRLVQECMVLTNKEVSKFMHRHKLPAIYRTQDESESTASYSHQNLGHKELNISSRQGGYVYATSPIRRFSDCINQMALASYLDGDPIEEIHQEFPEAYLKDLSFFLNKKSVRARNLTQHQNRLCEAFYLLNYAKTKPIVAYMTEPFYKDGKTFSKFQFTLDDIPFQLIGEFSSQAMKWYELSIAETQGGLVKVVSSTLRHMAPDHPNNNP